MLFSSVLLVSTDGWFVVLFAIFVEGDIDAGSSTEGNMEGAIVGVKTGLTVADGNDNTEGWDVASADSEKDGGGVTFVEGAFVDDNIGLSVSEGGVIEGWVVVPELESVG